MKALSLTQPWATLVAIGAKRIETRAWSTAYRGPLAIHAAKGFPEGARSVCWDAPFRSVLAPTRLIDYGRYDDVGQAGLERFAQLPRGVIVAVIELLDIVSTDLIRPWIEVRDIARRAGDIGDVVMHHCTPAKHELAFGDYTPGRKAWLLGAPVALSEHIPCRGHQSVWDVPADVAAQIEAQLAVAVAR